MGVTSPSARRRRIREDMENLSARVAAVRESGGVEATEAQVRAELAARGRDGAPE